MWRRVAPALCVAPLLVPQKPAKGLYLWGDNSKQLLISGEEAPKQARQPTKVAYFDNQSLRSVAVSSDLAVAVDSKGNVVQWTQPDNQQVVLKGKGIKHVFICNGIVVAVSGSDVYAWPADNYKNVAKFKFVDALGWFERFAEAGAGTSHVALRTNKGRVFTAMTEETGEKYNGQAGLAAYSVFDGPPEPQQLRQVKLLPGKASQIACGSHHTLALVDEVAYGWGSNHFGQLLLPYSFKTSRISVPSKLHSRLNGGLGPIKRIAAGGDVSFLQTSDTVYAIGRGEHGQFGSGSLAQCQCEPLKVPALSNIKEYDEKLGREVALSVEQWQVGPTSVFAQIGSRWMHWGGNESGQLGTGGLAKMLKPQAIERCGLGLLFDGDQIVSGSGVSAAFTKA